MPSLPGLDTLPLDAWTTPATRTAALVLAADVYARFTISGVVAGSVSFYEAAAGLRQLAAPDAATPPSWWPQVHWLEVVAALVGAYLRDTTHRTSNWATALVLDWLMMDATTDREVEEVLDRARSPAEELTELQRYVATRGFVARRAPTLDPWLTAVLAQVDWPTVLDRLRRSMAA